MCDFHEVQASSNFQLLDSDALYVVEAATTTWPSMVGNLAPQAAKWLVMF
jgi:type II secretory pathway predicted ATPase ExeA